VTQRVTVDHDHGGVHSDVLDQRWYAFLRECGLLPVPLPNDADTAVRTVAELPVDGVLITGGNDLVDYGGDAPERDATEAALVATALRCDVPLLGVCRGMQVLQHFFGVPLERVAGHVTARQTLTVDGRRRVVNSYHNWAATSTARPLRPWVVGPDEVVKAVRHDTAPVLGIMWHPERITPFADEDRCLFRRHFLEER
jgi:putative glutamine amidotransferase